MSSMISRLATVSASTKRAQPLVSGKSAGEATNLASVNVTPLDPVSAEMRQRLNLDTPHELLQTFAAGSPDIQEGDLLVVGSSEYPIRAVANWPASSRGGDAYLQLILEDLKR